MATKYKIHRVYGETGAEEHVDCELIALRQVAEHMHVKRLTPQQWYQRGLLPDHDNPDLDAPNWWTCTVRDFADRTGRSWYGPRPATRRAEIRQAPGVPPVLTDPFAVRHAAA